MIFNDFDEFLKAFQALYATEQCFFFVKSLLKVCLFGVPVILLMLTAETLMLDNSSKCFSDSFGKYSRHIHLRRVYVVLIMVTPRTPLIYDWIFLKMFSDSFGMKIFAMIWKPHNLFSFLGKGQDLFIFVMLIFVEMFLMVI